jgi:histidyl-tRNA synthetase
LGQDKKSIEVAEKVRKECVGCSVFYGKPGKALDYANSYGIGKVIFIGDEEVKKNKFKVKDMDSGKEKFISEKNLSKEFVKY